MEQSASTLERIEVAEKLATWTTHSRTASVNAIYLNSFAMASKFENTTLVLGKDGKHLKQARRELFNLIKGDLDGVIYMPLETDDEDDESLCNSNGTLHVEVGEVSQDRHFSPEPGESAS
jgi:hypothetical protein